jgi:eukaryotic-like serine/threonine-protein kinase
LCALCAGESERESLGRGELVIRFEVGRSSLRRLTPGVIQLCAGEQQGQFSPDGRWVAYTSNESGRNEVYVVPFHSRARSNSQIRADLIGKWQVSKLGGQEPKWCCEGKELFYVAPDNTLMSVPVGNRDSKFEVGPSRPLCRPSPIRPIPNSTSYNYDVSRDGSRIVISVGVALETTAPITLVQNWLSDFKE